MPEGPSIVILRELIEDLKLEGKKVIEVSGNTTIDKNRMLNQKVTDFKSWGKHFLICFEDFALRIHLMMFGSYRINDAKPVIPRIGFKFETAEINFYTCSLEFVEGDINKTYDWRVDILSQQFDEEFIARKLKNEPSAHLCDLLLDQTSFSGSGNIIKNEVLYRTRLHPLTKSGDLNKKLLQDLAKATRQYGFDFLKWKKANVLRKHWEVYKQKVCPQGHPLIKKQLGKTKRITFYCVKCQTLPPSDKNPTV